MMHYLRPWWATVGKNLLLLRRDRGGLIVLFVMPTILVMIVSLVQDNVLRMTGESGVQLALVDLDGKGLAERLITRVQSSGLAQVVRHENNVLLNKTTAMNGVSRGEYPFFVLIPVGTTEALQHKAHTLAYETWDLTNTDFTTTDFPGVLSSVEQTGSLTAKVQLYFDPMLSAAMRASMTSVLHLVSMEINMRERNKAFSRLIEKRLGKTMQELIGPLWANLSTEPTQAALERSLIQIEEQSIHFETWKHLPTAVQQNVPAWTLFGIFFVVAPLSSGLIRERRDGIWLRLRSMPISPMTLLAGRVFAYLLICLIQGFFMLAVGWWVLPLFGLPALETGQHPLLIVWVLICAGLAASSFGLLVGTLARSFEQAAMIGPVSVVIAAALGGILVPVYAMPESLRGLSHFSPLSWGHNAFMDLYVRGGGLQEILPETMQLLSFSGLCLTLAWFFLIHQSPSLS